MKAEEKQIIECPYWKVESPEDRKKVEIKTGRTWDDIGLSYPHYIGIEDGFNFQQKDETIDSDYESKTGNIYRYVKQQI